MAVYLFLCVIISLENLKSSMFWMDTTVPVSPLDKRTLVKRTVYLVATRRRLGESPLGVWKPSSRYFNPVIEHSDNMTSIIMTICVY